jgi:Cu+-exporting ATPase
MPAVTNCPADELDGGPPSLCQVQLSVGGMTCAVCVGAVTDAVSEIEGVSDVSVDLFGKSASAIVTRPELAHAISERIEEAGFECEVIRVDAMVSINARGSRTSENSSVTDAQVAARVVDIQVNGMYSPECALVIMDALLPFSSKVDIIKPIVSHTDPTLRLSYIPSAPDFTIRNILSAISSAKSPPFSVAILHPPTAEERANRMYQKEQRQLLVRVAVSVAIAIPTFAIGIVCMSLLKEGEPARIYFHEHIWAGEVSRGEWAQFMLATPVMLYCAEEFHRRSIKELYAMWRPGSRTPLLRRFTRFGSMNLLVSMGVSVAYFSSIALLGIAATKVPDAMETSGPSMMYFDAVVFLTMFLLIGRYLEAFSKSRVASAVSLLGQLRGSEALLLVPKQISSVLTLTLSVAEDGREDDAVTITDGTLSSRKFQVQKVSVDLLDVGDIVVVPPGATPPADGTIVSDETTNFDESSLTGESRAVQKIHGDKVYVSTVNKVRAVEVRVDAIGGMTMLDQVIDVVRQGQTKVAPIERLAAVVTAYFVPVITALAVITWVIWLSLGLGGVLPQDLVAHSVGGWPIWSLEFAIAVFVIACPCGIGLAAPTALLVGSGLAAKFGILARGGGEAFQEASQIDVVVFDKTGTLTEGGEPHVTAVALLSLPDQQIAGSKDASAPRAAILGIASQLVSTSSHPLSAAIQGFCRQDEILEVDSSQIDETPGRGLKGSFRNAKASVEFEAILGNETWMEEHGISISGSKAAILYGWKSDAKSVVILAVRAIYPSEGDSGERPERNSNQRAFSIVAMFAVEDRLREEARDVVAGLQSQGIETWMISGDNPTTAKAVAKAVGIPQDNVIAGVLPHEKAEKIQWLQTTGKKRKQESWSRKFGWKGSNERCIVAMVGDGINDAPALTTADVGIAIGSGSDVAISSAKFILVSSNLYALHTLMDLSRKVFSRIKFNFFWATSYNLVAIPIAAGAIFPLGGIRLSPVWSALAMSLSSTSVVCSSLLLKLYKEPMTGSRTELQTQLETNGIEKGQYPITYK